MRIAFNPSTVAALTSPPNNKDITFDLRGQNIFARGVKFYGTDTWRPVVDNLTSNSATSSLSANQGRVLAGLINGKSDSDHNHDGRYVKKSGDTMLGALNFANGTWNLVGDDSYIGDCNVGGHFGIRAANTTYPGIAFFNKTGNHLGNLTAYSGNIKYGAYSLQFLDNGNTSVSVSTWTNPFSAYNSNAVADGQAICVWGQASQLSNLSTDTGDMSLWLKRVNAKAATLNMVLDGEYYANGNQRLAHVTEIPSSLKNPYALTISLNGISQGPYDGSASKNINITPGSIGAATSGHNHDGRYVYNYGGTQMDGASVDKNALGMTTNSGITGEWWHILQAAWNDEYRWNSQIAFPTQNRNGMYYRSGLDDNTKWGSWVKLLDANNYSSTLDSRYYTESEVNSLLSNKLNTSNFNWTNLPGKIVAGNEFNIVNAGFKEGMWFNYLPINDRSNPATINGYHFGNGNKGYTHIVASGFIKNGSNSSYVLLGDGSHQTISSLSVNYANSSGSASHLEGGGIPGWGTLTAANGFTNVSSWDYGSRGAYGLCGKSGILCMQLDGYFYQNEGQYRVLDTSDVARLKGDLTVHQYLSATDTTWWPLIWGGSSHANTSDSTGAVYKSHDKLSWQTSSQTLYATHLRTTYIDLENSRGISQVTSKGTSPYKGIRLPDLQSNGIGMFSKLGDGNGADEGGIIISADTSVIYNSFDTGWGLSVRDKDRGQTDISGDGTIAFGVRQDYRAYSLGGFEKSGSNNSYVLLGGGGHKLESSLNVANADKLDSYHYNSFAPFNGVKFAHMPGDTIWHRILQFTTAWIGSITFMYSPEECQRSYWGIFNINIRSKDIWFRGFSFADVPQIKCIGDDNNNWSVWVKGNTNNYDPYGVIQVLNYSNASIVNVGLNKSQTTEPSGTYNKAPSLFYAGFTDWNNITNKPSMFNPAAHTHTVFRNNLMIKGTNGVSDSASIHLGIGDSDTGFKWISDGVCQIYANNVAIGQWTSGGMNWFKNPTVNGNKVWNAGNDGSGSGLDADTVDGEHANSFVRAGHFESANLNSLDTYSFIKSVNSNVAGASPNGNTGWYNVIQAVHRNGADDGPNYIGQIALGMTTNINGMFYRTKYNGSWYAWNEVVTTNTGLLRYSRNNVNISSPNCSPIPPSLLEWTVGYPRLYDPEFNEGDNNVQVYNNAGNGVVTVTRVHDTNVGNSSSYVMKVVSAAGAIPNYGGWHVQTQTELGKVYTCLFRASIPSGVEIEWGSNSIGTGGQMSWLTNNMGTGKWTWYAVQVYCGSGGSTTFFFSAKSPCTWYLSYVNVIENNRASYAGLRSVYSDYLKANASIVFGRNELQYFNQYTGVTAGATNNANPKTDWYHILRMNHANNSGYFVDLAIPFFDNKIQFRRITNGSDNGWRRVITEEPNHDVILREASTDGNVGIGINNPAYKLDVNGQMRAEGFHHWTVNSDNYMLLAGGGYKSFGGDDSNPIFLGYLNLDHGNDGTISSSFSCLGYSVPFTYTRGGNYCRIYIPDTTHQVFFIGAATASVHYSGGGMDTWTGVHRGSGAWWLHCYAEGTNEVRVKGFCQNNSNNDSWWGGNPLWSGNDGVNRITVCIFGYVKFR